MINRRGWRLAALRLPRMRRPAGARPLFRPALAASPLSLPAAFLIDTALVIAAVARAPVGTIAAAGLLGTASFVTLLVALVGRRQRAFFASALLVASACALGNLPIHAAGASLWAALMGAGVLAFVEAGGAVLEAPGAGTRVGRPGAVRAAWVIAVAAAGAASGWLLLALQPDLAGYGLSALVLGVLAALALVAAAIALARGLVVRQREG